MCTHAHTHARARVRAEGARGALGSPPATTPPVGKVDLALQLRAYIHCDWTLRNASPTGGVIVGPMAPLAPPACVCVYVCTHTFVIFFNCIKLY